MHVLVVMTSFYDFWHIWGSCQAVYNKAVKAEPFVEKLSERAGIVMWVVVGLPAILSTLGGENEMSLLEPRGLLWLVSYLLFGILFILDSLGKLPMLLNERPVIQLTLLTVCAGVAQGLMPSYGLMSALFCITASYAAYIFSPRAGFAWVGLQTVMIFVPLLLVDMPTILKSVLTITYFGFQMFSLATTYAAINEAKARKELAQANAELRAAQELLAESSRVGERLRIARELHDVIGHHLTALSLNLEVASRLSEGKSKEVIDRSHAIAKLLLSDVRSVVSTLRENETIDISKALSSLVEGIPKPYIHFTMPSDLHLEDTEKAQVVVRCIQEVITNAVKHANAENLWLSLGRTQDGITIHARDDGYGTKNVQAGNGLRGMRERLEGIGGRLTVSSSPGKGFELSAYLPAGA
jgi:signal transduction histidine kinase